MPLSEESLSRLRSITDRYCSDAKSDIPGATVVVVDKDGNELFAHSAGKRGMNSLENMSLDNIFWVASCTKTITGIACMQLVEQGILRLDDGEQLESLCPELQKLQILRPDGKLVDKNKKITLRMLLSHTAGFGYTFFNETLRDWGHPVGIDEFSGRLEDMVQPLLFEPGEGWQYGVNIDWAGIALERSTGLGLNDYMQKHIMGPLGLQNVSMFPSKKMKASLAYMHSRSSDGSLFPRDHLMRQPLVVRNQEEAAQCFNSGGAGLFAKPQEYCRVLSVLLNDGVCPKTKVRLLKKETVNMMFENQIPSFPNFGRQPIPAAKPDLTNPIGELYPVQGSPPQGWGLTFMLAGGDATGRSKKTAHWAGLANLWWWVDRELGVAGIVCTQILPFADLKVIGLWGEIETEVYKALG